jgi:hypothetical protein
MNKYLTTLICAVWLFLALTSCHKPEYNFTFDKQSLYEQIKTYLAEAQEATGKFDILIGNLSLENIRSIKVDDAEMILCDLKTYKASPHLKFARSYYKASFYKKHGGISGGVVYSISTNLSEEIINRDIESIIFQRPSSFTGEIVRSSLTGRFILSSMMFEGRLKETRELKVMPHDASRQSGARAANENCTDWYLVTTYYYDDGSTTQTREFIGTTCNGECGPQDPTGESWACDGGSGESGEGEDQPESITISDEADAEDGYSAGPRIDYNYRATLHIINGELSSVDIVPTQISNPHVSFPDSYGRNTTRILTTFGHNNNWFPLGGIHVRINWQCLVYGRWLYGDGTPNTTGNGAILIQERIDRV